jgi:hypothetical protein
VKNSIYDRIPTLSTRALIRMRRYWTRAMEARDTTPRFDYHGRCLLRATLELERRRKKRKTR